MVQSHSGPRSPGHARRQAASPAYPVRRVALQEQLPLEVPTEVSPPPESAPDEQVAPLPDADFGERRILDQPVVREPGPYAPTPVELQPVDTQHRPQPSPRRITPTTLQPKGKSPAGKEATAAQFKCPTREELGIRSICELTLDIAPTKGDLPQDCPLEADLCEPRSWCQTLYHWKASSLCHKPLYFEQVSLERYGHTWHPLVQPVVSGAHFFGTIPILPYKMGIEDPRECIYALGYYRPGECAPKLLYTLPLSLRGAIYQAAAVTGIVYVLP